MKKQQPKSYTAIQEALYTLISQNSFKQITINDICLEANVSRSTFYKHFPDKYAILEQENKSICDTIDLSLKEFFTMANLETSLTQLINTLEHSKFILLIDIEDSSVNLRKDLKEVFKNNYLLYYEKKLISQKWQIDSQFAIDKFCSIALTFLESSIKSQNQEQMKQNTAFIKEMVAMFLILK